MLTDLFPALAAITWDWDPAIIRFGSFELRYYGVLFALALGVGYMTLRWRYKEENEDPETATYLVYALMLGVVLGARLGHVFFYDWERYSMNPDEILKIWHGGLASHGAAVGIVIVCLTYDFFWRKVPVRVTIDRMAFTIPFAMICVRLGNFFNSEIVGAPVDIDNPFAFIFVRYDMVPRYPSQLFEAAMGIVTFVILFGIYYLYKRKKKQMPLGMSTSILLICYFSMRFFVEYFKEYQPGEIADGLRMGQELSIPFLVLGFIGLAMTTIGPWRNQTALQYTQKYQLKAEDAQELATAETAKAIESKDDKVGSIVASKTSDIIDDTEEKKA